MRLRIIVLKKADPIFTLRIKTNIFLWLGITEGSCFARKFQSFFFDCRQLRRVQNGVHYLKSQKELKKKFTMDGMPLWTACHYGRYVRWYVIMDNMPLFIICHHGWYSIMDGMSLWMAGCHERRCVVDSCIAYCVYKPVLTRWPLQLQAPPAIQITMNKSKTSRDVTPTEKELPTNCHICPISRRLISLAIWLSVFFFSFSLAFFLFLLFFPP